MLVLSFLQRHLETLIISCEMMCFVSPKVIHQWTHVTYMSILIHIDWSEM